MTWTDPPLITPGDIEDRLIATLRDHQLEHFAAQERRRGLAPRTLEPLATISHLAAAGEAQSGDAMPRCLIGWVGLSDEAVPNERDSLDVRHDFGVEIAVIGKNRRDTLLRRDWTAWVVIECLLQRTPRDEHLIAVNLGDVEPMEDPTRQRLRGSVNVVLRVVVAGALALTTLPAGDEWPPGLPGGPPEDPYDPPVPLPEATDISATTTREGID